MRTLSKRYRRPGASLRRAARRDGWHPDERCSCRAAAQLAMLVGGDGYWLDACLTCRKATR